MTVTDFLLAMAVVIFQHWVMPISGPLYPANAARESTSDRRDGAVTPINFFIANVSLQVFAFVATTCYGIYLAKLALFYDLPHRGDLLQSCTNFIPPIIDAPSIAHYTWIILATKRKP